MSQLNQKYNSNVLPTRLGMRSVRSSFNNIELTIEAKKFLADLNGSLLVIYNPNRDAPDLRIVNDNLETLGTLAELESLAKYKAIIGKKIDDNEKESEKDKLTTIIRNLRSEYNNNTHGIQSPERILEANNQRLTKFMAEHEALAKNKKVIESLPTSRYRQYLMAKIEILEKIQISLMSACTGAEKVDSEVYNKSLLRTGIPKWIEGKLIDKAFTKDVKTDAKPLLFSKGNFMKSVSLTTEELRDVEFCSANDYLISQSGVIHEMANSAEFEAFFTEGMTGETDEIEAEYLKLQWPMVGTETIEELLEPRINRHRVTGFSEYLAPKSKPGQKDYRPETAQKKDTRMLKNKVGQVLSIYLSLFHFIPHVDDSIADFWSAMFNGARQWTITPEAQVYDWIQEEQHRDTVLGNIRNLQTAQVKQAARKMVLMKLSIPEGTPRGIALAAILDGLGENTPDIVFGGHTQIQNMQAQLTTVTMKDLEKPDGTITNEIRKEIDLFRGKVTMDTLKEGKEGRSYVGSGNLVSVKAKRILGRIKDENLKKSIFEWIRDNFSGEKFQVLAAAKATAAVEDKGLGYDFDLEMKDEEDDDSSDGVW